MPSLAQSPSTNKEPSSLSLSTAVIAALSPHPYLLLHLRSTPPVRPSARSPTAFRPTAITTSSLNHCLGSAVVRQGNTAVVCGIQPELLLASQIADPPRPTFPRRRRSASVASSQARLSRATPEQREAAQILEKLNLLVPNIDLSTGCSPAHLPGTAPSATTQALSQRLYRLLLSSDLVQLSDLEIWQPKQSESQDEDAESSSEEVVAYYVLHINLTVLSLSGIHSLLSTAWLALLAALRDLRLPEARWDEDREMVLCSDDASMARRLEINSTPVMCCFGVFGSKDERGDGRARFLLSDPDDFEDGVCEEWVEIMIDCTGQKTKFLSMEKTGGGLTDSSDIRELAGRAEQRWREVMAILPDAGVRD